MKLNELTCLNKNINIEEYTKFGDYISESNDGTEWLEKLSRKELNNSKVWMYYDKDIPVCSMILIPSNKQKLEQLKINLNYKEVLELGPILINSKYEKNDLQQQMIQELDRYSKNLGYKYIVSTIYPGNVSPINNLITANFINIGQEKFNEGIKSIYLKCLDNNYIQKILTFIVKDNKYLLLQGSDTDPQFHESFWYVVTGAVEREDNNLIDTVRRELKEETNLDLIETKRLPLIFQYESLGKNCLEHVFISLVNNNDIILNEESIDYRWCDIDEFIQMIKWYGSKEELKEILLTYSINK